MMEGVYLGCPTNGTAVRIDGGTSNSFSWRNSTIDCAGVTGGHPAIIDSSAAGAMDSITLDTIVFAHPGPGGIAMLDLTESGGTFDNKGIFAYGLTFESTQAADIGLRCNQCLNLHVINVQCSNAPTAGTDCINITGSTSDTIVLENIENVGIWTNTINDVPRHAITGAAAERVVRYAVGRNMPDQDCYWTNTTNVRTYCADLNGFHVTTLLLGSTDFTAVETHSTATVAAATSADQNLQTLPLGAGVSNVAGATFHYTSGGDYTTGASGNGTMTFKLKACTVAGCGSGTVVTLATFGPTAAQAINTSASPWMIDIYCAVSATGASGSYRCYGNLTTQLTATTTAAGNTYTAMTTGATVDSTVAENLQLTVADSGASANNSFSGREAVVYPLK